MSERLKSKMIRKSLGVSAFIVTQLAIGPVALASIVSRSISPRQSWIIPFNNGDDINDVIVNGVLVTLDRSMNSDTEVVAAYKVSSGRLLWRNTALSGPLLITKKLVVNGLDETQPSTVTATNISNGRQVWKSQPIAGAAPVAVIGAGLETDTYLLNLGTGTIERQLTQAQRLQAGSLACDGVTYHLLSSSLRPFNCNQWLTVGVSSANTSAPRFKEHNGKSVTIKLSAPSEWRLSGGVLWTWQNNSGRDPASISIRSGINVSLLTRFKLAESTSGSTSEVFDIESDGTYAAITANAEIDIFKI
jgi:hypothetical protein